ncbi:CDP-alcohol phosphatidyltransferase family protein [Paracoccus aminophilus]|uniref:CDP-alcohol phosphatidyltransferase n=1 Tax=Paracoccus aminophilus JCM 7686 TaxID=1367847 RepID=S5Y780_PARAH|nr:CDP-alcohol phosphatidyltransferase family protein [Paracoccus aminophilus]AGT11395.1 CDP-alcohol phosphatidyltransferase [Paracoccus aminophilus JCM 7686]
MTDVPNRRPLASRQSRWAGEATRRLVKTGITPNQISMLGMVAALVAGLSFWGAGGVSGAARVLLLLLGAVFVQARLICNLLDGMVAVEGGKRALDGGFWNEFPDRVSDLLILLGIGLGLGHPALGWAAVSFAFLTAYVRELGVSCGRPADFAGPMAKQHRMALVTGAAVLSAFAPLWSGRDELLLAALWLVAVGAALTALRRSARLVIALRRGR